MSEPVAIRSIGNGVNQKGLRNHNERLILSLLQRQGAMAGRDIARAIGLSAQTVSVILRKLEADGLLHKQNPLRGKVGKPLIPMALTAGGAFALGFKLGRRSSELVLIDLSGAVLFETRVTYDMAVPEKVFRFLRDSVGQAVDQLGPQRAEKLCGIGIAVPFEIWKWAESSSDNSTRKEFLSWSDTDFHAEIGRFTDLPVFIVNDATGACWAEHVYGRGKEFRDYAYFFVSTFVGGGIVINQSVYEGGRGNAGALGSVRVGDDRGQTRQLIDVASIHLLETELVKAGHDPRVLWKLPQDWSGLEDHVAPWIERTGKELAQAALSVCAVIDFEAIVIDGACPPYIRSRLTDAVRQMLPLEDSRGLILPLIEEGTIGSEARAIGAASAPIFAQLFLTSRSAGLD